jgi:adenylate cyclase
MEMLGLAASMRDPNAHDVQFRIGIASGPVIAGIVGVRKFFYDVWGDAVNVASRMESTGLPGRIQVSPRTYELAKDQFEFEPRGPLEVKGKGVMTTWLLKQGTPLEPSPGPCDAEPSNAHLSRPR